MVVVTLGEVEEVLHRAEHSGHRLRHDVLHGARHHELARPLPQLRAAASQAGRDLQPTDN